MKNFLIQRITENDDYTETPSDLPVDYIGGMTAPEFFSFLKQLGYDITKSHSYRTYQEYWAIKNVPIKEIKDSPIRGSKHLYFKISLSIYLNYTGKNYPEILPITIYFCFNIGLNLGYSGFYTHSLPNKNNPTIVPESFIDFLLGIEQKLPNIENANTINQIKSAFDDLSLMIQKYNKQTMH